MVHVSHRSVIICALLLLGALLAGCIGAKGTGEGMEREVLQSDAEEESVAFRWEAPKNFTGPLVLRFTYTVEQDSHCEFRAGAAFERDQDNPVLFWGRSERSSFSSGVVGHDVQVHAEDLGVDTREEDEAGGLGASVFRYTGGRDAGFTDTWTIGSPSLSAWSNSVTGDASMFVEVECADSRVRASDFGGGHEFKSFRDDRMEGTGASASVIVGGNVQSDRFFTELESPSVVTHIRVSDLTRIHAGSLDFHHPEGIQTHLLHSAGTSRIEHHGGPGTYGVEAQRVAAGAFGDFFIGVFVGYAPGVQWDDLVAGS